MRKSLLVLLIILLAVSCSDKNPVNSGDGTGTAVIICTITTEQAAKPADLKPTTSAIISFYNSQNALLTQETLTVSGKRITGSVKVKAGSGYRVELLCYDNSDNITHNGTASNVRIVADKTTTITIILTPAIPVAPQADGPDSAMVSGTKYTITWTEVSRAKSYTIEEAANSNFTNPNLETVVGLSNSETKITDTAIAYYYRIKANNSSGSSDWSNVIVVTVEPVTTVQYMLTMAVNQSGWGTTTPSVGAYSYDESSVVVITATPAEGYRFVNWTGNVADPGNTTTTVTLTSDTTVTAVFEEEPETQYTLTLAVNNSAWGETFPAVGGNQYIDGTTVSITAVPADGYRFVSWSGVVADATSATTTVTVTANSTVTAIFEKLPIGKYSLTMTVNQPGWGTIDPPPGASTHDDGSIVTITATPASGYRFINWTGTVADASSATTTVTLNANVTVTANFEVISMPQFTLTMAVNPSGWGTTTPSVGDNTYDENTVVSITAAPAEGYRFVNWTGDVTDANSSTTTVTMSGDTTVIANFEEIPETTEIVMVSIPAGSFRMGDIQGGGGSDERPVHSVTLSAFEMSIYEITQWHYESIIGSNPSQRYGVGANYPVYYVSWYDAVKFCNALSEQSGLNPCYNENTWECDFTKDGYRLPTEAEWEYACSAGTETKYYWGDSDEESVVKQYCWYEKNADDEEWTTPHADNEGTQPVGTKLPNDFGLYDMSGNLWEWCNDWYGYEYYSSSPSVNPIGPVSGYARVGRGGSWGMPALRCLSSSRSGSFRPDESPHLSGFRVVRGAFTPGYTISGTITGADDVTVTLSGDASDSQVVDTDGGSYSLTVAEGGSYTVTPSKTGYTFTPTSKAFSNVTSNQTQDFTAIKITYTLTMAVNQSGWGITTPSVGAHTYDENTVVSITATIAEGYSFVNWTGDVADASSSTTTVTITGDKTVTANFEEFTTPITMVSIPGGTFQMGDLQDGGDDDERFYHDVTLDSFEISAHEITQGLYKDIMGENPSGFTGDDNLPVEKVSWYDAVKFCNSLSEQDGLDPCYNLETWECDFSKDGYRLPTEAEWEYACRAGTSTKYYTGNAESDLAQAGWYSGNSSNTTHPVGLKEPNAWDLYDMHGNVWEWCNDWYNGTYYIHTASSNPIGTRTGINRIDRGGAWQSDAIYCRSANRAYNMPDNDSLIGFRVVRGSFTPGTNRWYISGTITGTSGVSISFSGDAGGGQTVSEDGGKYFAIFDEGGTYTVTPSKIGYTFEPESATFSDVISNQSQNFTASQIIVTISGTVSVASGVTVTLSGDATDSQTVTSDGGSYSFTVEHGGSYTVTPSKSGYSFTPTSKTFTNVTSNQTQNFTANIPVNEFAFYSIDDDLANSGYQGGNSVNGIIGGQRVGFAVYVKSVEQLRTCVVDFTWDSTKAQYSSSDSGFDIDLDERNVNGINVTLYEENVLGFSVSGIGEINEAGHYSITYAKMGGDDVVSDEYGLVYCLILETSGDFNESDELVITTNIIILNGDGIEKNLGEKKFYVNSSYNTSIPEITMVSIPGGSFRMGDIQGGGKSDEHPVHYVTLDSFKMSIYEVTQEQYDAIMGVNPSYFSGTNLPVEGVSWYDAVRFCNKLSDAAGLDRCYDEISWTCNFSKNGFRLPTEAEWEYACRAGTETKYFTGNYESDLGTAGWYSSNSGSKTHPVGQKTSNAFGLYDMHGNVWEWCNDWYDSDYYDSSPSSDPTGPSSGSDRVGRGGGWFIFAGICRSAVRYRGNPTHSYGYVGFRIVRRP